MKTKIVLGLMIGIVVAAVCWKLASNSGSTIETATPLRGPTIQAVYATGTVEASRMIPISPKIGARLTSLELDEGSEVQTGTLLAMLESNDLQAAVTELQARLELAEKDLARAQKLSKVGAVSKEGLETSQTNFTAASASLDRARAELSYLELTAPEAGTIIRRDGEIGEFIPTGTPVFWINGGNKVRIETEVDEEDIGLVEVGQKVVVGADAFPNQIFNGKVQSITPKGDPVARSYRVRVTLDDNVPLLIGMTAETNIITQEKDDAMMVPLSAVKDGQIIRIASGKAESIAVKTGIKTQKEIEILEGINEGDVVAVKFDSTLPDKGRLHAKNKDWKLSNVKK